jgi:hypothetical protein
MTLIYNELERAKLCTNLRWYPSVYIDGTRKPAVTVTGI